MKTIRLAILAVVLGCSAARAQMSCDGKSINMIVPDPPGGGTAIAGRLLGYPGTSELFLALERGEIDMTATGVSSQINRLLSTGRFDIVTSYEVASGGRQEFGDVPIFKKMMEGRIADSTAKKAFDYYL